MTTTTFIENLVDDKPKRTRKTHNKVRTGCLTCKVRRKKCDETKPACRRCTSTGRKCDGYESVPLRHVEDKPRSPDSGIDISSVPALRSNSGSTRSTPQEDYEQILKLWRPPSSAIFSTDEDFYCFDFFRSRTGPEFGAYFDSSIWKTFVLKACLLHPTVLQAAAAVGAAHRRFELGISREAFEFCAVSAKQYHKAVTCLKQDLLSNHPNSAEINMITSILLSVFEIFQSNYDVALEHFTNGLKLLLNRKMRTTHSETQYKCVNIGYGPLHDLTDRMERQAVKVFQSETNIIAQPGVDPSLDPIPPVFNDLEQARDILITEGQWIWDAWTQLELGNLHEFETQQFHISRLLEWSIAFAEYNKIDKQKSSPKWRQAAHILKAYRECLYLVLLTQIAFHDPDGKIIKPPCDPPETCGYHTACIDFTQRKAALNAHLARILVLTDEFFDDDSKWEYHEHSLSVDSGIGPPLYLGARKCRSTKVRHQVNSLLNGTAVEKKLWQKFGIYTIAERTSSIEEHAVVAAGAIPDILDPKWVDLTFFLEESKLLLRYCRQDEYGGLIWTQQWIQC